MGLMNNGTKVLICGELKKLIYGAEVAIIFRKFAICIADIKECDAQVLNDCTQKNAQCEEDPNGGYNCVCGAGFKPDDKTGVCVGKSGQSN